jgi:iron complex transport system permease protein
MIEMDKNQSIETDENPYSGFVFKKLIVIIVMIVFIVIFSIYSISVGAYHLSFGEVIDVIFGGGDNVSRTVIWDIRIPRVVAAILVGGALAVSGTIMQCVLKNPLASPYTLGISSAAAFGAAVAIAISYIGIFSGTFIETFLKGTYGMTISAFIWSMIAVLVIIILSRLISTTPESMILTGVAMGAIFTAALASLQYFVDSETLSSIVYWQFGDLSKAVANELWVIFFAFIPIVSYFLYKCIDYNAMEAGEDVARCLGVNTKNTLIISMTLASMITAICISIVGIIGFVGLLAPHMMRRIIGGDHRFLIPSSILLGAIILLVADFIGRNMFAFTFPVGIITSFLGGPLFIFILSRERKKSVC